MKRGAVRAVGLAPLLAVALLVASMSTASANTPWTFGHGWAGESHYAGQGYITNANTVGTWEEVMIKRFNVGLFTNDGIWSGAAETWWTNVWQSNHASITPGLSVDGIVGPQTWAAARFWHLRFSFAYTNWEVHTYTDLAPGTIYFKRYVPFDGWATHPLGCSSDSAYRTIGHPVNDVAWWQNCE
jgi:hypothetical protein